MPKTTRSSHLYSLAKRGAEVRVHLLVDELRLLFTQFPHLKDSFDADELPIPFILEAGAHASGGPGARKRKPMSAAAKRAVGLRMKKYWAERRKAAKPSNQ